VSVAIATLAWGALPAEGETEPQSSSAVASCPAANPPNELALTAGTPQTAMLGSAFSTNLQVALTNSNGCPLTTAVAGIPVTFSAPFAGASGSFAASGSDVVTVGSDASGTATAPLLSANYAAGAYTVTASSVYGSILFSLANVEGNAASACGAGASATAPGGNTPAGLAGRPRKLTVGVGATQSAPAGAHFPIRLAVTVTDAQKNPVPGALVAFAAPNRGPSGFFTVRSGGAHTPTSPALGSGTSPSRRQASRRSHLRRVEMKTDACGIALAPAFTANHRRGGYIVLASVERLKAAFALVNEGR